MSSFWSNYDGIERVVVGQDGETEIYVELKKSLTASETKQARNRLISTGTVDKSLTNGSKESEATVKVDYVAYQRELVIASLVDWNIPPRDGVSFDLAPESARRESVDRLPSAILEELGKKVMAGNSKISKDEQRKFPVGVGAGGEDGEERTPDDSEVLD